tara:strand:- start:5739 stop:6158 length:420 start_codon:yes stop_codon:yes gene_type:complete
MKNFKTLLTVMIVLAACGANQVLAQSTTIKKDNQTHVLSAPIEGGGELYNPPPPNLVSLKESVKTEMKLFPNPSSGNFNLETNLRGNQKLVIVDLAGNVHMQKNVFIDENGRVIVDLNSAARGLYLVRLGDTTLKFQKI